MIWFLRRNTRCEDDVIFKDLEMIDECLKRKYTTEVEMMVLIRRAINYAITVGNITPVMNVVGISLSKRPNEAIRAVAMLINELAGIERDYLLKVSNFLVGHYRLLRTFLEMGLDTRNKILRYLLEQTTCSELNELLEWIDSSGSVSMGYDIVLEYAIRSPACPMARNKAIRRLIKLINDGLISDERVLKILKDTKLKIAIIRSRGKVKEIKIFMDNHEVADISEDLAVGLVNNLVRLRLVKI
jgi:hypothetical protein